MNDSVPARPPLILTLGYGKRSLDEIINLLRAYGVQYLADVRSVPWSRYRPEFTREALRPSLEAHGIRYVFMGEELGGRPDDPSCYDAEGRVEYEACRRRPQFAEGIARLRSAWEEGHRVALLCSESRPQECHRAKLIGAELARMGIPSLHLGEQGEEMGQEDVLAALTHGQLSLFEDMPPTQTTRSRGRYGRKEG